MSHKNTFRGYKECKNKDDDEDSISVPPLASQESCCSSSSFYSQSHCRKRNRDGTDGKKLSERKSDVTYVKSDHDHGKKSTRRDVTAGSDKKQRKLKSDATGKAGTPTKRPHTKDAHTEKGAKNNHTKSTVQTAETSRKNVYSQSERLPEEFLPSRGKVKVRKYAHTAFIQVYGPYDQARTERKKNFTVGKMKYSDITWRRYHQVVFKDGYHYLQFELTLEEKQKCNELKIKNATYGWCIFEYTKKHKPHGNIYGKIPEGKSWHRSLFHIYTKPTVLISLFDGIGGSRVAIDTLPKTDANEPDEFNVIRTFVSENDETAMAVTQRYAKDCVDLGTVENISRLTIQRKLFSDQTVDKFLRLAAWNDEVHFIIIAGPPCQDLSRAGAKDGVTQGVIGGTRSQLFFHVPRLIRYVTETFSSRRVVYQKIVHYIVENVEMARSNQEVFTEFLGGVKPFKVDFNVGGCCASLMSRRRLYFCSFRKSGEEIGFFNFKKRSCAHPAKLQGKSLDYVLSNHSLDGYEFCDRIKKTRVEWLGTLTRFEENVGQEKYYIREKGESNADIIPCPVEVIEDLMGFPYPYQHTKFGVGGVLLTEGNRRKLLGNTFLIYHIKYLLLKLHDAIHNLPCKDKAFVEYLPQELAKKALKENQKDNPTSVGRQQKYSDIINLLYESKFDELDSAASGTLYGCWKAAG